MQDHHSAFVFVGGRPSLDLVATLGRRHARPVERIPDAGTLARWFVGAGILSTAPHVRDRDLERARTLREAIHALVRATIGRHPPDPAAIEVLNRHAAGPDVPPRLVADGHGRLTVAPAH
ncbi:MAG: ABATE domain-containing protein, partial [Pseudonocardia sp.]